MKKILAIVLAAAMLLSMTACGAAAKKDTYVVGICQLVQHEALDAATQGFIDALNEALPGQVNSFHPSLRLAYKAIKSASAIPSCSLRQPGGIKFTPGKSRLQTSMDVFLSAVTENSFFHFCGRTSS